LDAIIPPLFNLCLLTFPLHTTRSRKDLNALQDALSTTVRERPYLAGEVVREGEDHNQTVTLGCSTGSLMVKVTTAPACQDIQIGMNDVTKGQRIKDNLPAWIKTYDELWLPRYFAPMSGYMTSNKVIAA